MVAMSIPRPEPQQKIPEHAKKVFEGILFDIYQWEQELFDGTTATFEKAARKTDSVVVVPVLENGNIILIKEEQPGTGPMLGPPGGMMDPGEEPEAGAARELLEEAGCGAPELVLWEARQPSLRLEWATYAFVARGCRIVQGTQDDGREKVTIREVNFDEFLDVVVTPEFDNANIQRKVLEAKCDPQKMSELKELFGV